MLDLFLMMSCFFGFVYAFSRWVGIEFAYAPIFSASFIGIFLFVFAVSNHLKIGVACLVCAGFGLAIAGAIDAWYKVKKDKEPVSVQLFVALVLLIIVSFIVPIGSKFSVIDDYAYWGIMGKYLYLNHHLPDSKTAIFAKHLAYTPGTSLFHYFFYTLAGKYTIGISYFAQNVLLVSALFVVLKKEQIKKTTAYLCLLIILLILFCGNIFTKLQVDYLLSIYFFAVLWIYFREQPTFLTLLTISLPICCLFLIKEIGFALGLILLVIIFFDLVFQKKNIQATFKSILFVFFTGSVLFLLKQTWANHCQMMGFLPFDDVVNIESVKQSFRIFSDENIRNGFFIFIKGVLIGPADRLNIPYLFWYTVIIFFWIKILDRQDIDNKARYARLLKILFVSFGIYLIMIYFLQVIVFRVGISSDHPISLTRYLNILFSQVVFFTTLLYFNHTVFQNKFSDKTVYAFIAIVVLILGLSRIETSPRKNSHDKEAEMIAEQIGRIVNKESESVICVVPGINDQNLGIKLLYHLLPNRVNVEGFPSQSSNIFLTKLQQCNYVFFNYPDRQIMKWINPFIESTFENQGFFKILPVGIGQRGGDNHLILEKLF